MVSLFSIIRNPYVLIAIPLVVALILFRREVGSSLSIYGQGLGDIGVGIQRFVSAVGSPTVNPTVGFSLAGVFKDAQNYFFGSADKNTTRKDASPSGSSGGFNVAQSTSESGGSRDYSREARILGVRGY